MIRQANENDIPALMRLLDQVNRVHHEGRPDIFRRGTKYDEADLAKLLHDPDTHIFVSVNSDGNVTGHAFCALQQTHDDRLLCDRKTLYIDDICVDETARGSGIGRRLYDACELYARQSECDSVTLNVWSLNRDAEGFYQRLGLVPLKTTMERIL